MTTRTGTRVISDDGSGHRRGDLRRRPLTLTLTRIPYRNLTTNGWGPRATKGWVFTLHADSSR